MINLLRLVIFSIAFAFSGAASAADYMYGNAELGYIWESMDASCRSQTNSYAAAHPTMTVTYAGLFNATETGADCGGTDPSITGAFGTGRVGRVGDGCAPPKTYDPVKVGCVSPPPLDCKAGEKWVVRTYGSMPPANHGGCQVSVVKMMSCKASDGKVICMWEVVKTGAPAGPNVPDGKGASDDIPPPPATAPSVPSPPIESPDGAKGSCPAGTVQAGVSAGGTPMCIGGGTDPTNPPPPGPTTTKPPVVTNNTDGSSTSSQEVTRENQDGSKTTTTTTTTTAVGGAQTVTVTQQTTVAASGAPGSSDQAQKEKGFCQQNPNLSICRESSVSGTCGQISCQGDAVQCATLRAAAIMECRERQDREDADASPVLALGRDAGSGNDPEKGDFPSPQNAKIFDVPSTLDSSGWLGGGQCFTDKVVQVMGRSISLPFSKVCDILIALRYALMIVAGLISYRTVSNAVLGV